MASNNREDQSDFFLAKQQTQKGVPFGDESEARCKSRSRR